MEKILKLLEDKLVVIFSKILCCMSYIIKLLIFGYGVNLMVYELDEMFNGLEIE